MKVVVQILLAVIFGLLGWILLSYVFEWVSSFLDASGYRIVSTESAEQFYLRLVFSLILAMIPIVIWISKKFIDYKTRFYQSLGSPVLFVFGVFFVLVRLFVVRPIRTNLPNIIEEIPLNELKINSYLLLGILVGVLLYFGLGFLTKQLRFARKNAKTLAE